MQTSLPTKTRLGQQTVCKETYDEKLNKKLPEYFYISQQNFLHIIIHEKSHGSTQLLGFYITFTKYYSSDNSLFQESIIP